MIKQGMTVIYQNNCYRVRTIVDYRPYPLAQLPVKNGSIWVPVEQLTKLEG
ncbi:MAG: hypothetical protein ABF624_01570 [Liquorilactobacillus ghanensis]|uniref:hypothetical protein n=1 Tax=Liquorilactobacillus TaxID=2767888 RepID=UPI0039E955B9